MKSLTNTFILFLTLFTFTRLSGQEWEMKLEGTGAESLEAISFPDSIHGWMVGTKPGDNLAYILHSDDKGETWNEQTGVLNRQLSDVHFSDEQTGFVLGASGLQKTEDGGISWIEVELGSIPEIRNFVSFDIVGPNIWILGEQGLLIKSEDGGVSWVEKEPLSADIYKDVAFHGQDTGIIVGQKQLSGIIMQTTDGGDTWVERTVESELGGAILNDVFFADDTTIFTGGRATGVVRSLDGGFTWKEIARLEFGNYILTHASFYFEDAKTGWVTSSLPPSDRILHIDRTVDGGETWTSEFRSSFRGNKVIPGEILFDEGGNGWTCGYKKDSLNGAYIMKRGPGALPEALCKDITAYIDETGIAYITPEDIDNGSSDNSGIIDTMWVDKEFLVCTDIVIPVIVSLYVADPAGNVSTCQSEVVVVDSIIPVAVCKDISIQLDSTGNAQLEGGELNDGSYDNCSVFITADPDNFTTENIGVQSVTMTVKDGSGNSASCSSNVTIEPYSPVSVEPGNASSSAAMLSAYPNPFDSQTTLEVKLGEKSAVVLEVYNASGQLVEQVFDGELYQGEYSFSFSFQGKSEGMYFCVLKTGAETFTEILIKR